MSITVTLNGTNSNGAFLIAPDQGRTFPARLGLSTDDGSTVTASLKVLPGGAAIELERTEVTVGPAETFVGLHATSPSGERGDSVVQVLVNDAVQSSCALTGITNLKVWFKGRFQARFATDNAFYNEPRGQGGWTFALEGESDFVPADSLADRIDKPVGREIRFHNPVDLRPEVAPIGVAATSITGKLANGKEEEFTTGDPVLGRPVDLGPSSYFAGNSPPPAGTQPAEGPNAAGHEPIALFEFHIGSQFSGKSLKPEDRPITFPDRGFEILTAEQLTRFGIPPLSAFNAQRKNLLQARLDAMTPADQTGTVEGRNLQTRINRLGGTLKAGWIGREWFTGLINDAIQTDPQDSVVLQLLQGFDSFLFSTVFYNFHADELCGQVLGYITSAQEEAVDPFEPKAEVTELVAAPESSRTISRRDPSVELPADIQDFL
jgi:hypothetical protein